MNGGKWTEWEQVKDHNDFRKGQLVRIVPFNGTFGPWSQGYIKEKDKNIIHLESSKNKVTVKINIKKIFMYKYYIPTIKMPKSATKKGGGRRKKSSSPRRVKAAKKIQEYVRKRRKNKFKMQDDVDYVTVTGKNFNKDDFYVGQKIDIRRKYAHQYAQTGARTCWPPRWLEHVTVMRVENSELSCTMGNRAFKIDYNSIYSVRFYKEKKRPKSAMKKGGKFKMQDNADYVTVTGKKFNKDDFYVGQKIDIRRHRTPFFLGVGFHKPHPCWWLEHVTVMSVENSELSCTMGNRAFKIDYNSIYSVRFYKEKKRPKSAMKKGGKFKMQDGVDYVTVTGKKFNKDDFYVGQIINMKREGKKWIEHIRMRITKIHKTGIDWEVLARVNGGEWKPMTNSSFTNYNSIHSVRFYKEKKRPKSAAKKGGKFKMQDEADYVIVTVNDLNRYFNKTDFKDGEKIDVGWQGNPVDLQGYNEKFTIRAIDKLGLSVVQPLEDNREFRWHMPYRSIYAVKYYDRIKEQKKRPKSAAKTGKIQRKSPNKKMYKFNKGSGKGGGKKCGKSKKNWSKMELLAGRFTRDDFTAGERVAYVKYVQDGVEKEVRGGTLTLPYGRQEKKNLWIWLTGKRYTNRDKMKEVVRIDQITSVEFKDEKSLECKRKPPKSAAKAGGGRKKRRSPSPRRVKAAKKKQNQTYNKNDFEEGDEFERITWWEPEFAWVDGQLEEEHQERYTEKRGKQYPKVIELDDDLMFLEKANGTGKSIYYYRIKKVEKKSEEKPKRPKSAAKKGGGRKKRRSPPPRRVKAAKKIQSYIRRRRKSSKTSFQMQGGGAGERRVFRDELPGGFYEMHFRVGEVLKLLDVDGEFPKWGARIKSVNHDGIEIYLEGFSTTPIFVPYENIREVIFQRHRSTIQKKKPKSAAKKGGGRKKPKSAAKKGGGRKKRRSPSPRRVKAAKKIQNYVRRRKSPKKGGGRKSPKKFNRFNSKKEYFRQKMLKIRRNLGFIDIDEAVAQNLLPKGKWGIWNKQKFNKKNFGKNQIYEIQVKDNLLPFIVRIAKVEENGLKVHSISPYIKNRKFSGFSPKNGMIVFGPNIIKYRLFVQKSPKSASKKGFLKCKCKSGGKCCCGPKCKCKNCPCKK